MFRSSLGLRLDLLACTLGVVSSLMTRVVSNLRQEVRVAVRSQRGLTKKVKRLTRLIQREVDAQR